MTIEIDGAWAVVIAVLFTINIAVDIWGISLRRQQSVIDRKLQSLHRQASEQTRQLYEELSISNQRISNMRSDH